jgi:hypothetical protein
LRYVANHAVKAFRAFDYNQVIIKQNGFLNEFLKAQSNGNLALAAVGTFDPRYNPAIKGSQPLPIFDQISNPDLGLTRGGLTNSFIRSLIQTGEPAELATQYQINSFSSPIAFFTNQFALGTDTITNFSNSTYNSLQFEARRRVSAGLNFQANYTFAKVLTDADGDTQNRFQPFLDLANTKIERAPAPFDIRHAIKANWIYELPMGKGHRFSSKHLNLLMSGWSVSSLFTWQSGSPFSIISGRGTLNRTARSFYNTAVTALTGSQLDKVVGFYMTGNGPYFINQANIGPDGRAVAPDGTAPFSGQVFFNPDPGMIGPLQRRRFNGPWTFDMDAGMQKLTHITEKQTVEFRMEAGNVFNHPTFVVGDQNINSTTFGQIAGTFTDRRVIQFGLYYRF